jgi:hypothetical protein
MPELGIPAAVWRTPLILRVIARRFGEPAVPNTPALCLSHLSHQRPIVGLDNQTVRIQYKTGHPRTYRRSGNEFMRRFLQSCCSVASTRCIQSAYGVLWCLVQSYNGARYDRCCNSRRHPHLNPALVQRTFCVGCAPLKLSICYRALPRLSYKLGSGPGPRGWA